MTKIKIKGMENVFTSLKNLGKKADLQRIIVIVMFAFIVYSLFLSVLPSEKNVLCFVFAADDNTCNLPSTGTVGDNGVVECTSYGACGGGPQYGLSTNGDCSGDASCASTSCCGDDTNEFVINETSSTDAPSGFNDEGISACCDAAPQV